jgi:hypothetical protein
VAAYVNVIMNERLEVLRGFEVVYHLRSDTVLAARCLLRFQKIVLHPSSALMSKPSIQDSSSKLHFA